MKLFTGQRSAMSIDQLPKHFEWVEGVLPPAEIRQLLEAMDQPLDISIRINRLKVKPEKAILLWAELYGWETEPVPFCSGGYWIRNADTEPSRTIEHRMGYFYIQEAASMLPVELFDCSGLERPLILDMAASPGGKTTHLADSTNDLGLVIANDASRSRIPALQIVLRSWGTANQAVTCLPGEAFGEMYPNLFDAVLLDAPCSMQGLRTSESHPPRPITENEIGALAARQVRLLESALRAVKTGGQVVYSTCTLTPQENEGVLAEIIRRFPHQIAIADVRDKLPSPALGLDEHQNWKYPLAIRNAVRVWPHRFGTAGFFAAKIVKTGELPETKTRGLRYPPAQQRYRALNHAQSKEYIQIFSNQYGFNLGGLMETQSLRLFEINRQIYLLPSMIIEKFAQLPWISCGMQLGKGLPEGWQPSHEFTARFGDQFTKGVLVLEDEHLEAWQRGEDIRGHSSDPSLKGNIVVVRDGFGRNLGRAKALEKRLRNLLPTRLF